MKLEFGNDLPASFKQRYPPLRQWMQANRVELLLFLLLWGTFAYFYQSTQQNEAARFDQTRAIVEDHTLAINNYWWNSADVIRYTKNGQDYIYPNKAPGTTLLAVPVFWVVTHVLRPFKAVGLPEWVYWHLVAYLTIIFTIGLLSALAAVAIYKVLVRITHDAGFSVFAVLAIWLGTMAFPFSTLFFSHQLAAALLSIAFYLMFMLRRDEIRSFRRSVARLGAAGILLGFAVATEYPTALLVAVLMIYTGWVVSRAPLGRKEKGFLAAAFFLGLGIGAGVLVIYNVAAFGKVFYVPYEAYAKAGSSFPVYSRGLLGLRWLGMPHFLHALASITIYPPIGILYIDVEKWRVYASNPVLWLIIPGMTIMLWQRKLRPEGLLILSMIVAYVLFITSYGDSIYDWSGASYLGPRHIIPLLPFLALPIYYGGRKLRLVFYPLLAISVFYMLLATAVEPRVPYPFENPARDSFLPDYLHGRLAQNTDTLFDPEHRKLTKDSTAFNLGKVARLPGSYQLAPLMLWWLVIGSVLLVTAARNDALAQPDLAGLADSSIRPTATEEGPEDGNPEI